MLSAQLLLDHTTIAFEGDEIQTHMEAILVGWFALTKGQFALPWTYDAVAAPSFFFVFVVMRNENTQA